MHSWGNEFGGLIECFFLTTGYLEKPEDLIAFYKHLSTGVEEEVVYATNLLKNQNLNYHPIALPWGKHAILLFLQVHHCVAQVDNV